MPNLNQMDPVEREVAAKLYIPAFLTKLAQLGIPIQNEEQLDSALETVAILKAAQAEQAAGRPDLHKVANEQLKAKLGLSQPKLDEPLLKVANTMTSADPRLAAALLQLNSK